MHVTRAPDDRGPPHGAAPVRARGRFAPAEAWRAFVATFAAAGGVLHRREYVGLLAMPVTVNALVAGAIAAGAVVLYPVFASWFAMDAWPVFDGVRAAAADTGAVRLLLATAWLLGPCLLELAVGPWCEPLVDATRAPGAPAPRCSVRVSIARLRDRARLFAAALLLLPFAWALALVPYVGLPAVLVLGALLAAAAWTEPAAWRDGAGLGERLATLRANAPRALGFGIAVQLALMVPFLDLLLLAPMASVAATSEWLDFDKARRAR